jgi:hypothetical protein
MLTLTSIAVDERGAALLDEFQHGRAAICVEWRSAGPVARGRRRFDHELDEIALESRQALHGRLGDMMIGPFDHETIEPGPNDETVAVNGDGGATLAAG